MKGMNTSAITRAVVVSLSLAVVGLTACALDPTDGSVKSGGVGALGTKCACLNGQADCDSTNSGCASGLRCTAQDLGGDNVCTTDCPCPLQYVCKAAGIPGQRLACFKSP